MFLSKLVLNLRNSKARYDLARPYEMHRSLMNSYPYPRVENRCDLLYRGDISQDVPPILLVQTRDQPDWYGLGAGYLVNAPDFKPLALPVTPGQRLRFRLRANPTKRVAAKNERLGGVMAGKRIGLATEADQLRWLLRKASVGGFSIPGEWVDAKDPDSGEVIQLPNFRVDAIPDGRDRNDKKDHGGEFLAVRFEGVLVVIDPITFRATVATGLGSAKAFGFGLLSVAPARDHP
jgi:CRISPR system Cascade subunit CasE